MFQSCIFSAPTPSFASWSQNENPPPQVFPNQHPDFSQNPSLALNYTGLGNVDWTESGVSCLHHSNTYSDLNFYNQNQIQNQALFSAGGLGPHVNHSALFGSHTYEQSITADVGSQEPWVPQDFHLDSRSGALCMDTWTSQITDNCSQDLCSPQAQYPSPHYPQIPNISPDHQMFHTKLDMSLYQTFSPESLESSLHLNQTNLVQDHLSLFNGISQSVTPSVGQTEEEIMSWIKTTPSTQSSKLSKKRLLCTGCQQVFRSLSAMNSHICDTKTPPIQTSASTTSSASRATSHAQKEYRSCSVSSAATGGALPLYTSLMHLQDGKLDLDQEQTVGPHYIPPPMLSPMRAGPGLYCSIAATRSEQRTVAWSGEGGRQCFSAFETLTNQARINVGKDFQAEIPSLRHLRHARCDSHNAVLLWAPWEGLNEAVNQQRVTALLSMVRSSVMPRGGASADHALQILSESRGNFLETVEKLLSKPSDVKKPKGSKVDKIL